MNYRKKVRLGDLLVQKGIITEEQLGEALKMQKEKKMMLGEMIVTMGFATQSQINDVLCEHLNIDFVDMREEEPDQQVLSLLDESIMRKYTLVPLRHDMDNAGAIQVAMADPMNILAMDDINIITGMQVVPLLANAQDINAFLDKAFGQQQAQNIVELYKKEQGESNKEAEKENNARREEIENAPIVVLINNIIEQAVRQRASDIHIEPLENLLRVRYRIDGQLVTAVEIEKEKQTQIIGRLKAISNMHQEKQESQDGRILAYPDYNIRVSSQKNVYGEKFVLRLLKKNGNIRQIFELGFPND